MAARPTIHRDRNHGDQEGRGRTPACSGNFWKGVERSLDLLRLRSRCCFQATSSSAALLSLFLLLPPTPTTGYFLQRGRSPGSFFFLPPLPRLLIVQVAMATGGALLLLWRVRVRVRVRTPPHPLPPFIWKPLQILSCRVMTLAVTTHESDAAETPHFLCRQPRRN